MKLSEVYAEIAEDAKNLEAAGIVIILATEHAPVVIRTMPDEMTKELLRSIVEGDAVPERMQ